MVEVTVAQNCGFCPGVRNAISLAEEVLAQRGEVYSLGPIIHNNDVVTKLSAKGLRTVESIDEIPSGTVLIRSHGASPADIDKLRAKGLEIVDATCVLVKRVQEIAHQLDSQGYQVVVIGNKEHPEVRAVVGCAKDVIVVAEQGDLHNLPPGKKLCVVCQTTQSPEYFRQMLCCICGGQFHELRAINTLCAEAIRRQKSAVELCRQVDIMFVLGGLDSANTRKLAELCRAYNKETYHLQNYGELDTKMLCGKRTAGVTAGASTPDWIISELVEKIRGL